MKVRLTGVRSGHARLRDKSVVGWCETVPSVGETFFMTAPPRDQGDMRLIHTTQVTKVESKDGAIFFETRNSHYKIEMLGEDDGFGA
jgi:hypothetical protein